MLPSIRVQNTRRLSGLNGTPDASTWNAPRLVCRRGIAALAATVCMSDEPPQMVLVGHGHQRLHLLEIMLAVPEVVEVLVGVRILI